MENQEDERKLPVPKQWYRVHESHLAHFTGESERVNDSMPVGRTVEVMWKLEFKGKGDLTPCVARLARSLWPTKFRVCGLVFTFVVHELEYEFVKRYFRDKDRRLVIFVAEDCLYDIASKSFLTCYAPGTYNRHPAVLEHRKRARQEEPVEPVQPEEETDKWLHGPQRLFLPRAAQVKSREKCHEILGTLEKWEAREKKVVPQAPRVTREEVAVAREAVLEDDAGFDDFMNRLTS